MHRKHVVVWMLTSETTTVWYLLASLIRTELNYEYFPLIMYVTYKSSHFQTPFKIHLNLNVFGRSFTIDSCECFSVVVVVVVVATVLLHLRIIVVIRIETERTSTMCKNTTNCQITTRLFLLSELSILMLRQNTNAHNSLTRLLHEQKKCDKIDEQA